MDIISGSADNEVELHSKEVVRQTFFCTEDIDPIQKLYLALSEGSTVNDDDIVHVRVTDFLEKTIYLDEDIKLENVVEEGVLALKLDEPITQGKGNEFHIYIETEDIEDCFAAFLTTADDVADAHLTIRGQEQGYDLVTTAAASYSWGFNDFLYVAYEVFLGDSPAS